MKLKRTKTQTTSQPATGGAVATRRKHGKIIIRSMLAILIGVLVYILMQLNGCFYKWGWFDMGTETNSGQMTFSKLKTINPIDFDTIRLETGNNEIFAWIRIPNTKIDYPVLRSASNDGYYMDHNVELEEDYHGAIFMERQNSKSLTDSVTVLYGHNDADQTMFRTLHYFENKTFFDRNEYFTIYVPGHIYTYRIISAYNYDDRHILNSFDFTDVNVVQEYFDYVCNPDSLVKNVRTDSNGDYYQLDATKDKIVQLSTCVSGFTTSASRYIVTGVLVNSQSTF